MALLAAVLCRCCSLLLRFSAAAGGGAAAAPGAVAAALGLRCFMWRGVSPVVSSASSKEAFLNFWDIRLPPRELRDPIDLIDPVDPYDLADPRSWWWGGGRSSANERKALTCMRFEDGVSAVAVSPEESCFAAATLGGDVTVRNFRV